MLFEALDELDAGRDLLVLDRGYVGNTMVASLAQRGLGFCLRAVSVKPAAFFRRVFRSGEFLPSSIEHGRPGNGQGGNGALASA